MSKHRIIRIFGGQFEALQSKSFTFVPSPTHKRMVAYFFSDDASVSFSTNNNTALVAHKITEKSQANYGIAPDKRLHHFQYDLNGSLHGMMQNLKNEQRIINLYAIITYENQ